MEPFLSKMKAEDEGLNAADLFLRAITLANTERERSFACGELSVLKGCSAYLYHRIWHDVCPVDRKMVFLCQMRAVWPSFAWGTLLNMYESLHSRGVVAKNAYRYGYLVHTWNGSSSHPFWVGARNYVDHYLLKSRQAKEAVETWLLCARSLGLYKDVRGIIARMIWSFRANEPKIKTRKQRR